MRYNPDTDEIDEASFGKIAPKSEMSLSTEEVWLC
jgi:hypothetical protein